MSRNAKMSRNAMSANAEADFYRLEGNKIYRIAIGTGLSAVVSESRLERALTCYTKSFEIAVTVCQKASSAKNCGVSCKKLALSLERHDDKKRSLHYYKLSMQNLHKACEFGKMDKSAEWCNEINSSLDEVRDYFMGMVVNVFQGLERAGLIKEMADALPDGRCKGSLYYSMAETLFHLGVTDIHDKKDYRSTLILMKECYYPMEEAARFAKRFDDEQNIVNVKVLKEDVYTTHCLAESCQAVNIGDELMTKLIFEMEDLNMSLVYEVIDWYRNAVILTKEKEIEFEAVALSRLGRVYSRVLKLKFKAKEYYGKSVELALTLFPRSPEGEDWFKEAKSYLDKCQQEVLEAEMNRWENRRKPYVEELKTEIEAMDNLASAENDEKLIRFIYKTHPPKDKKQKLLGNKTPWDKSTAKKALLKAITHYHPDRIDIDETGMKWKVLCEEITKILNNKYMRYKGVD